jgi:hypothetical protein
MEDRDSITGRVSKGIFLLATVSRPALGPSQPPIQWAPRVLSPEVKRAVQEFDRSPPSSAQFKNVWIYTSTPPIHLMTWHLIKHRCNFVFTLCKLANKGMDLIIIWCTALHQHYVLMKGHLTLHQPISVLWWWNINHDVQHVTANKGRYSILYTLQQQYKKSISLWAHFYCISTVSRHSSTFRTPVRVTKRP